MEVMNSLRFWSLSFEYFAALADIMSSPLGISLNLFLHFFLIENSFITHMRNESSKTGTV